MTLPWKKEEPKLGQKLVKILRDSEAPLPKIAPDTLTDYLTQEPWDTSVLSGQKTFTGPVIYDAETNPKTIAGRISSPFYGSQVAIAAIGSIKKEETEIEFFTEPLKLTKGMILIGHNVKFDALHSYPEFRASGAELWCTQLAEHQLFGMHHEVAMTSLDQLAKKYGGYTKIDIMRNAWGAGYGTSDVKLDIVLEYLGGDIENTKTVYLGQIQVLKHSKVFDPGLMLKNLKVRQRALQVSAEIEWNGMKFDIDKAQADIELLKVKQEEAKGAIFEITKAPPETNLGSAKQKSAILFGGVYSVEVQVPWLNAAGEQLCEKTIEKWPLVGGVPVAKLEPGQKQDCFKSGAQAGQPKFKNVTILGKPKTKKGKLEVVMPRIFEPKAEWANSNGYSTGAEILDELEKQDTPITRWLKQFNRSTRDLTTYGDAGKGLLSFVGPDGFVRGNINKALTNTGRASSSKPNLQNLPDASISNINKCFISRFPGGTLQSWDFSQIEVITHYGMSNSRDMIEKLNQGLDLHLDKLSTVTGRSYEELRTAYKAGDEHVTELRRAVKPVTFQGIFEAMPKTIAATTGLPESQIKAMLQAVALKNPERDQFLKQVQYSALKNEDGKGRCYWQDETGTLLSWEIRQGRIKPTELANRLTQAYAGFIKDLVQWEIYQRIKNVPGVLLVNEVHDEYVFDVAPDKLKWLKELKEEIQQLVRPLLSKHIGRDFPINFKMGMEPTYGSVN